MWPFYILVLLSGTAAVQAAPSFFSAPRSELLTVSWKQLLNKLLHFSSQLQGVSCCSRPAGSSCCSSCSTFLLSSKEWAVHGQLEAAAVQAAPLLSSATRRVLTISRQQILWICSATLLAKWRKLNLADSSSCTSCSNLIPQIQGVSLRAADNSWCPSWSNCFPHLQGMSLRVADNSCCPSCPKNFPQL